MAASIAAGDPQVNEQRLPTQQSDLCKQRHTPSSVILLVSALSMRLFCVKMPGHRFPVLAWI